MISTVFLEHIKLQCVFSMKTQNTIYTISKDLRIVVNRIETNLYEPFIKIGMLALTL
jgi:hypothetical protein